MLIRLLPKGTISGGIGNDSRNPPSRRGGSLSACVPDPPVPSVCSGRSRLRLSAQQRTWRCVRLLVLRFHSQGLDGSGVGCGCGAGITMI